MSFTETARELEENIREKSSHQRKKRAVKLSVEKGQGNGRKFERKKGFKQIFGKRKSNKKASLTKERRKRKMRNNRKKKKRSKKSRIKSIKRCKERRRRKRNRKEREESE